MYVCTCSHVRNTYSTVGRFISNIYNLRRNIPPRLYNIYRGYGPTYCTTYTIYYCECAADEPFA